jgi:hypothetical protein
MDENPYQPPLIDAPTLAEEKHARLAPRPLGIAILSWLHLLAGGFFVFATCVPLWQLMAGEENRTGLPYWFQILLAAFMTLLAGSSSVGMWRGARWGWWLGALYYVWSALGVVAEIPYALPEAEELDQEMLAPRLAATLVRLAIFVLVALYFFKGSVRAFFGLQSLRMVPALNVLVMISIVLVAGSFAVVYFQIGAER